MKSTEFAERQYETTFHLEIGSGGGGPFVPTQPLEMYLGIDAATNATNAHRIWQILKVNIPRRVNLSPVLWPSLPRRYHTAISGRMVSLFIQFKVPKYNDSNRAKYRGRFGSPYFEVAITKHQQSRLAELQRRVQSRAIVRYASPAFWTRADFDRIAATRSVLAESAYLIPSRVRSHKKWMYTGPTGPVILNPDPEEIKSETWQTLTELMSRLSREDTLRNHIVELARLIRETTAAPDFGRESEWIAELRKYAKLTREDEEYLFYLRTVVDTAELADTTWVVMFLPDDNIRSQLADFQEDLAMLWMRYF